MSAPVRIELKLHIEAARASGEYVNFATSQSSGNEVACDFYQVIAGTVDAHLRSRVIMTPQMAKAYHASLGETLRRHEELFGSVNPPQTVFTAKDGN